MIHFHVDGPHEIKPLHLPHGRFIDREVADRFWEEYPHIANGVGCYIFSMRAGKGLTPIYVGQSKTGFRHECFQDHKLRHYQRTIQEQCGTPMLFFLVKDRGSHASFEACIDRVENFLIQLALQRNPDLKNIQCVEWSIEGFFRASRGQPSTSARELRRLLGTPPNHPRANYHTDRAIDAEEVDPNCPVDGLDVITKAMVAPTTDGCQE